MFGFAEDAVKGRVKEEISRGKVDVFISVNVTADAEMKISLNRPVLEGYLAALNTISKDYGVPNDDISTSLARMPDVFVVEKQEEDEKQITGHPVRGERGHRENTARCVPWRAALEADLRPGARPFWVWSRS